jgi:hypothetical protein
MAKRVLSIRLPSALVVVKSGMLPLAANTELSKVSALDFHKIFSLLAALAHVLRINSLVFFEVGFNRHLQIVENH